MVRGVRSEKAEKRLSSRVRVVREERKPRGMGVVSSSRPLCEALREVRVLQQLESWRIFEALD